MIFWDGGIGEPIAKANAAHFVDLFRRQIFPNFAPTKLAPMQNSVLAKIRAKRAAAKAAQEADATSATHTLRP